MDTLIALIRNGACVVKDVAPATHWVMAPVYGPITMIEAVIAPTQFAAVYLNLVAAVPALVSSCYLWWTSSAPSDEQWAQAIAATSTSSPLAVALAEASLAAHTASARQGVTVSVCKLVIGCAFFALFGASVHHSSYANYSSINWCVLGLLVALAALLTVMAQGVGKHRRLAADKSRLAAALRAGATSLDTPAAVPLLLNATHLAVGGAAAQLPDGPWSVAPAVTDPMGKAAAAQHVAAVASQVEKLDAVLRGLTPGDRAAVAGELEAQAKRHRSNMLLEAVCLFLNAAAGCGYSMFAVTFLNPDAAAVSKRVPVWPGHAAAEWGGNLLGDVAWTIEPTLLLLVPRLIEGSYAAAAAAARSAAKKEK